MERWIELFGGADVGLGYSALTIVTLIEGPAGGALRLDRARREIGLVHTDTIARGWRARERSNGLGEVGFAE